MGLAGLAHLPTTWQARRIESVEVSLVVHAALDARNGQLQTGYARAFRCGATLQVCSKIPPICGQLTLAS